MKILSNFFPRFFAPPEKRYPYIKFEQFIALFGSSVNVPRVLYFGDSVLDRVAHQDTDRRPLSGMMAEAVGNLPGGTFAAIADSAYNPAIYFEMIRCLDRLPSHPELILLHLNLRCFSPQWDLHPLWQFQDEIRALRQFARNPKNGAGQVRQIKNSPDIYRCYDRTRVRYAESNCTRLGEFRTVSRMQAEDVEGRQKRLRELFVFHYLHRLEVEHRKLRLLENFLAHCMKMGLRVMTYITPINWEAGERLVGPRFSEIVSENIATLEQVLRRYFAGGFKHLDLARHFSSASFFHPNDSTEHLNEKGRQALVEVLLPYVADLLCPARSPTTTSLLN